MQREQAPVTLHKEVEQQKQSQIIQPQQTGKKPQKNDEQQQINNVSHLSVSSCAEKEQKQSSNDGLNSQRSYPSSMSNYNEKDQSSCKKQKEKIGKGKKRPRKTSSHCLKGKSETQPKQDTAQNQDSSDDDSEGSQLQYSANGSQQGTKATITMVRIFLIICKKEYFYEIIRILAYSLLSILIFSYVLDQNRQKKQFYEAFYSSEQITISKDINGVFPPLFGSQNDIVNHTWILESYNNHLMVDSEEITQQSHEELLFQFKLSNVLYIRPNVDTCVEQLKFRWKTFDYNMRIYEIVESEFQKIDEEESKSCFKSKKYMAEIMKEVSLWTIDWESKQLYLLTEPFRDEIIDQSGNSKPERWNELIVLKKQSQNV